MNNLVKVSQNEAGEQITSARDLHSFLEIKKDFSDWIKTYIGKSIYGFENGIDYTTIKGNSTKSTPRPRIEYILKLDMAKELCMLSKVDKGKQARRYFIACEKKLRQIVQPSYQVTDPIERAKVWIEEEKKRIQLENQIKEDKPRVEFAKAVESSNTSILIGELAKLIKQNGVNIGQNRMFLDLRNNGYLGKKGENYNLPTQKAMNLGLFEIKKRVIQNPDGSSMITRTTKVTYKGQEYFINKYLSSKNK